MSIRPVCAMLLAFAVVAGVSSAAAAKEGEPVDCVRLAHSWDDAVAEAKLLHVPIVVHNHGFYCGPCWGMHASLMCNDKYIAFAREHTVEVIALERLQEGIDEKSPKAATYKTTARGQEVECLVEFPGLTPAEMLALASSKAGTYNDTGKIPFTCLVDPFTLTELKRYEGGGHSAKSIMEDIEEVTKSLQKEHGEGFSPKAWQKILEAEDDAWAKAAKEDYAKAVQILQHATSKVKDAPEDVTAHVEKAKTDILAVADAKIEEIRTKAASDPIAVKSELRRLASKLKGTDLEAKAKDLLATL